VVNGNLLKPNSKKKAHPKVKQRIRKERKESIDRLDMLDRKEFKATRLNSKDDSSKNHQRKLKSGETIKNRPVDGQHAQTTGSGNPKSRSIFRGDSKFKYSEVAEKEDLDKVSPVSPKL